MSKLENFDEGDKVLFNDRKTPLNIKEVSEDELLVEGPSGGEYEIYFDGDTLLVARKGNKKYASYCNHLRSVGKWVRDGLEWSHTKSGAKIKVLEKDNGFYGLESEKFGSDLDSPMYGYTSEEAAVEEVESFIGKCPEG